MAEMVVLPGHRPEPAHLPEQPLHALGAAAQVGRQEFAGLLGEIEQDGAGLEHRERRAAARRIVIDDGGDAVIGRDFQELAIELFAFSDVDRNDFILKPRLFEEDRDLMAVGGGPVIDVDHRADSLNARRLIPSLPLPDLPCAGRGAEGAAA